MYLKHLPNFVKPLARDLVFTIPNDTNAIYLSFDDGPHPTITPWVLDQLDLFGAKSTFFLLGSNAACFPELVMEIKNRGHAIGNHSYSHPSGWKTKDVQYFEDIKECQALLNTDLFRPPYGQITGSQTKVLREQYRIVMWSDLSADFDQRYSPEQCYRFATEQVTSGSIVVFHDSEKAWPRLQHALPKCLEYYAKSGCTMSAISGMGG